MTPSPSSPPPDTTAEDDAADELGLACVLTFNTSDPSGAGGLSADLTAMASVGCHPMPVVTGAYARDTTEIFDHFVFDDDAVAEQARAVLEDITVQAIKVGFVGSPEIVSTIAQIATDYAEVPVIAYMPNLSWWQDEQIDQYLDAFQELLLPQTSVLVGNHSTLWRWLLPDWGSERRPSARDLAKAAGEHGVPYLLVTGIPLPEQYIENTLATPQAVLTSAKFERFEATFSGAGDTLSAALTALIANGTDLVEATNEALTYLDRCLDGGFHPGMGHVVPDRMFWALAPTDDEEGEEEGETPASAPSDTSHFEDTQPFDGFVMPPHDTKH